MAEARITDREAKDIYRRIEAAVTHQQDCWLPDAREAMRFYRGYQWPGSRPSKGRAHGVGGWGYDKIRITVNQVRPTVETMVANVAFAYPDFFVRGVNEKGWENTKVAEQLLRYDWRVLRVQGESKRCLRDRNIYGVGVMHDGWEFTASGEKITKDRPFAVRVSPVRFYVDPECDADLENALYCGYWEVRSLEEVRADGRFSHTRQLKGAYRGDGKGGEYEEADLSKLSADEKRVQLFHYYEKGRRLHCVFSGEHDKPLLVEDWKWVGDWYPFSVLRVADDEDRWWPTPPIKHIAHAQREINEARTQHSMHRRQLNRKFQTRAVLTEKQRGDLQSDGIGVVLEEMQEYLTEVPPGTIQKEVLEAAQLALGDLQFIMGLNDYETATPPTKRLTSSEVEAVRLAGGSRGAADRQEYEQFCARIAEHLLAWEQKYGARTRALPIFDKDDQVKEFTEVTPEDIAGQYLIEVYVGSTSQPNRQNILESISFFLQSVPGFIDAMEKAKAMGYDLSPILAQMLAAIPEIRHANAILEPKQEGPPAQQPSGESPGDQLALLQALAAQQGQAQLPLQGGGIPGSIPMGEVPLF